ncbi:PilZ domain-containing protein [Bradyrhizobium sp. 35]|nr:PilZ domain-containing protein [Bradyrhizobium sp. 35]
MQERRQTRPHRDKRGRLHLRRRIEYSCRVVDITDHGASIELPASAGHTIRDRFKVMIEKDRLDRNCRLIWRSGSRIGVEFTD